MRTPESTNEPLLDNLAKASQALTKVLDKIPSKQAREQTIEFTGGNEGLVSVCDLLAYQIGWGKAVLSWYKAGLKGKHPEMPLKGFGWDYEAVANHFYEKYADKDFDDLRNQFAKMVREIEQMILAEQKSGNLHKEGVWDWCQLKNGKYWSLSKWIQVNTVAPYKRATKLIKTFLKET